MTSNNSQGIQKSELNTLINQQGYKHRLKVPKNNSPLMQGHFFYEQLSSGISIHGSDVIEQDNAISSTELPASLSFNVLLAGKVNFSLENKEYTLSTEQSSNAICSVGILSHDELLTRKITAGQDVQKVNIFVKRSWLEKHCRDLKSKRFISQLFSNHARLYQWQDDGTFALMAQQLIEVTKKESLQNNLLKEQVAYSLLSTLITKLPNYTRRPSQGKSLALDFIQHKKQLKFEKISAYIVEHMLDNEVCLADISKHFSISISTLQRYFKNNFNMTVNEFIRIKRLERAKASIAISQLSIGEAAYQAGYNHVSNFTTAFKKHFSITPAHLVKTHQVN